MEIRELALVCLTRVPLSVLLGKVGKPRHWTSSTNGVEYYAAPVQKGVARNASPESYRESVFLQSINFIEKWLL